MPRFLRNAHVPSVASGVALSLWLSGAPLGSHSRAHAQEQADLAAPSLGFDEAVERALMYHPTKRVAEANVERARATVDAVRAHLMPTARAGVSQLGLQAITIAGERVKEHLLSHAGTVALDVPIIAPRAWTHRIEAKEELEVAEMLESTDMRQVAINAGHAWTLAVEAEHVFAAREVALSNAEEHLRFATGRTQGGLGTTLDVVRAQREVVAVRALLESARSNVIAARELLGVFLGHDGPIAPNEEAPGMLQRTSSRVDEERVYHRPDVKHAELSRVAAHTEVKRSFTDWLPELRVHGEAFMQDEPIPTLPLTGVGYLVQTTLSMPLWDGGVRRSQRNTRKAKLAAAEARLENLDRTARAEVRAAAAKRNHALAAHADSVESARLAHEAVDITRRRYADGLGTDLDVIDALREARDADIAEAIAEHQVHIATLELLAAEGEFPKTTQHAQKAHKQ